ncbi:hypothetical protein EV643_111193 [Kribbella sp. VKM Ac-2527]|uniref:Patatin-like phospholipase n=1 Tax=Kribbella caucasensis TaxID=2512215 RepID=A0A4R6KC63_9ACTN|nr:hypothetical protein [Kribbella sp. VKM Ac-2527]TDO46340.1 hypothetical protein EV643_111193 [Kribbella sp. VKM Ac-2527]
MSSDTASPEPAGTPWPPAPQPVATRMPGALLAALVALWLAMNEISLLSGGFLADNESTWSFNGMSGPFGARLQDDWHGVLDVNQLDQWEELLFLYLPLDALFIAGYVAAAFLFTRTLSWVRTFVIAIAAFDALETVGMLVLGGQRCAGGDCVSDPLVAAVAVFTSLKWAGVLMLVIAGAIATVRSTLVRRIGRALWIQRFGLLAFLPIAALTIVPGSSVFDQLPDVQRRWLDEPSGILHAIVAGLTYFVVLLPAIFVLGRIRADWALRRVRGVGHWPFYDDAEHQQPRRQVIWLWVLGPLVLLVVAGLVDVLDGGKIFWPRLVVFSAIPIAVIVLSRWRRGKPNTAPKPLSPVDDAFPGEVMAVGDVLTVAALSLAGLGMVRAFAGLASLEAVGLLNASYVVVPGIALLVGVLLAVLPWFAARPVLRAVADWGAPGFPESKRVRKWIGRLATPGVDLTGNEDVNAEPRKVLRAVLLGASIAGFVALAIWPRPVADVFGVLAATMLSLTTLVVMVGVVVVYAQERQPPEVFQWGPQRLRRRATPIIGLLVLALLVTGLVGGKTDIHPVDAGGAVPDRPTMQEAFEAWVAQDDGCAVPVEGSAGLRLRPMLMVAAEGGGIRATYWTASALQRISAAGGGCGRRAALFSAGASGGALGLTVARFTDQPLGAVEAITSHHALGAATISLLSGDLLASATGVRFNAEAAHREPVRQPLDRAELMETSWERELADLRTPFLPGSVEVPGAVTGQLILTSTAVRDGCNALVSQVDLSEGAAAVEGSPVCGVGAAGAHNYDLFGSYGRTAEDAADECLGNVPALTAGLLASRFPYVTPSGVVSDCRGLEAAQLVDGGYTDNTGLSTIVDLGPSWQEPVRRHNDQVVAAGTGDFVVPLVVYIENGTGPDFSTRKDEVVGPDHRVIPGTEADHDLDWMQVPESLVPPVTKFYTARNNKAESLPLLGEAAKVVAGENLCTDSVGCRRLRDHPRIQDRIFVIHQSAQPSLSAPLGWVLSAASQKDLADDLQVQATKGCEPDCVGGFATLQNLLSTLELNGRR